MTVSEFLKADDIPTFLLGAFYGRFELSSRGMYIYTYSSFKNWTIFNDKALCDRAKDTFIKQANDICAPYSYWRRGDSRFPRANIVFALENDLNLTADSFFNRLNRKILNSDFIDCDDLTEDKKMFIRGFSELRASFDRVRNLLTMDYVKRSRPETKRVRLLIDSLNVPVYVVNYNFREFQPDFIDGIERETQLRYNILWYATNIGFINEYRSAAFAELFSAYYDKVEKDGYVAYYSCTQPARSDNTTFENRLAYYAHNVFGRKLTDDDRRAFRELIGAGENEEKFTRDMSIVNYVRYCTPDVCVCCCDDYDIRDRTHIENKTGRPHFEIHHVISVGKNKELDDVDNLAKICPACHASLGRGSADERTQKELIRKIFGHKDNILAFCRSYFDEDDFETVVDLVWKALK